MLSHFEVYGGCLKNWCKSGAAASLFQVLAWEGSRLVAAEEESYQLEEG